MGEFSTLARTAISFILNALHHRFHAYNIGLLSSRASAPLFSPCTPAGVMLLLESTGINIAGKHAVVLGRSDIVGSPVCALLRRKDATVTQCHSRTQNLENIVRSKRRLRARRWRCGDLTFFLSLLLYRSSKPTLSSLLSDRPNLFRVRGSSPEPSLSTSEPTSSTVSSTSLPLALLCA